MAAHFDIFRIEVDGRMYWLGRAEDLEDAKARVKILSINSKREFCAIDQTTNEKVVLKPEEHLQSI
jgi:hypothetical protein